MGLGRLEVVGVHAPQDRIGRDRFIEPLDERHEENRNAPGWGLLTAHRTVPFVVAARSMHARRRARQAKREAARSRSRTLGQATSSQIERIAGNEPSTRRHESPRSSVVYSSPTALSPVE